MTMGAGAMKKRRGRLWWPLLFALALVVVCTAVLVQRAKVQAGTLPVAMTAEEAVQRAVQKLGFAYAGPCSSTRAPDDLGKDCSTLVAQQGNVRAYEAGQAFSEFDEWIFVAHAAAGWSAVATVPFDETATSLTVPWPAG
jgi:hypothetical protein